MPAKPTAAEPDPAPADTKPTPETPAADPVEATSGRLPAGTYAYTGHEPALYLEVPLTARPGTVADWPFGAPDDGRWTPTRKQPNTRPDNEPAASPEEE